MKRVLSLLATAAVISSAVAQTSNSFQTSTSMKDEFENFRQSSISGYDNYKQQVLDRYADYLDSAWKEYEAFSGKKRDETPKPAEVPVISDVPIGTTPDIKPQQMPSPTPSPEPLPLTIGGHRPLLSPIISSIPKPEPIPGAEPEDELAQNPEPTPQPIPDQTPEQTPDPLPEPRPESTPTPKPKPDPGFTPEPLDEARPIMRPSIAVVPGGNNQPADKPKPEPIANIPNGFSFNFYDIALRAPMIDFDIKTSLNSTADYASQWRELDGNINPKQLSKDLKGTAQRLNLNDYLTYEMVRDYVKAKYSSTAASSRTSLVHYLLAQMGYNVRLAVADDTPLILMATKQTIYGRPYLNVDGVQYYTFTVDDNSTSLSGKRIYTCQLPEAINQSAKVDMIIGELNLPYMPHTYSWTYDDMKIEGDINANLYPILFKYPQIPIGDYAASMVCPDVRRDVEEQMANQLQGMTQRKAVDKLLRFIQKAFPYATDDENFGFEKPYFFEEVLFYDKCDCEDRAVFYSHLLWNVLGVNNHIINFPGHEAVAVNLPDEQISGTSYSHEGSTYYISDPTYIGSSTGMCMPRYASASPRIDYEYK